MLNAAEMKRRRERRAAMFCLALINSSRLHDWGLMLQQVEQVASSAQQSEALRAVREELDEQIRVSLASFPAWMIAEA